jgi:hypothetical protein
MNAIEKLHLIIHLTEVFYPFFLKIHFVDYLYLSTVFGTYLSWTLLDGECAITLVSKKILDPNYKIGSDIKVTAFTPAYKKLFGSFELGSNITTTLIQIGAILVLYRNHFNYIFIGCAAAALIAYRFLLYQQNFKINIVFAVLFGFMFSKIVRTWFKKKI